MLESCRLVLPALLLLCLACAGRQQTYSEGGTWEQDPRTAGAEIDSEADKADRACAREIRSEISRLCSDAPPALPEGYASRARRTYEELDSECSGMRARLALRELDDCVYTLEQDPTQIDMGTQGRRESARESVADLKADPLYSHARRRVRDALDEASQAALDHERALKAGNVGDIRFRAETWAQAEADLQAAQEKMRELLSKHGIDSRDARSLGLW